MIELNKYVFENNKHRLFITPSRGFASYIVILHTKRGKWSISKDRERYFRPYNSISLEKAIKYFNKRKKELEQ